MTDFVSDLIKKFKKPTLQTDPIMSIQPDNKNDLISPDSVLLDEQLKGNVYCLKDVIVDKSGDITGNIHSRSCVVNGKVNGNILSVDYIEVTNTAIIEGNIKSGSIQIEAGSIINGFVSIEKKIKLPAIIKKMAEELSDRPDNLYATVKHSPLTKEAETPEIIPGTDKIVVEPDKKIEVIHKLPLKKDNTSSSNDSWW